MNEAASSPAPAVIIPKKRFFVVGDPGAARVDPRVVAHAVVFNLDIREGEREFSAPGIPAHEIPLLRKKYGYLNGSVTISKGWVPSTSSIVPLNQAQFLEEIKRLTEAYQFKTESRTIDFLVEIYGSVKKDQVVGIMRSMKQSYKVFKDVWPRLMDRARANWPANKSNPFVEEIEEQAYKEITDRELNDVVAAADPGGGMGGEDGDLENIILQASAQAESPQEAPKLDVEDEDEAAIAAAAAAGKADVAPRRARARKEAKPTLEELAAPQEDVGDLLTRYFIDGGMTETAAGDLAALAETGERVSDEALEAVRELPADKRATARKLLSAAPRPAAAR